MRRKAIKNTIPLVCLAALLLAIPLLGQKQTAYQAMVYNGKQGKQTARGILFEVGDSSLVLVKSLRMPVETEVRAVDIRYLKVRKEGGSASNVLIGAGAGLISGLIFGGLTKIETAQCSPGDDWCEFWGGLGNSYNAFYMAFTTLAGAGVGAVTGALIGGATTKIDIDFSRSKYLEQKKKLESMAWNRGL
jgi:hypothetical protein